ncbi:MAG: hypothetical protein PCFJNLEI_04036 [Verrucomicrobiae bacterium]|nr:hypothetical protein [Verrucomicrobiae bacterium]
MKLYALILLVAATTLVAATNEPPTAAEQERMFMEAVLLRQYRQYAEAEVRLKQLAVWQPEQATIKEMLADVQSKLKAREAEPVNVLKRRLAETIMPAVNFREATALDVVQYLQTESGKLTADKAEVNIVWMVPPDAKVGKVTLNLKKVPLGDVLNYVTQLAGLKYRVESHAVVIYLTEAPNAKTE